MPKRKQVTYEAPALSVDEQAAGWDGKYGVNHDILFKYDYPITATATLEPGVSIKVKNKKGNFTYLRYAKNIETGAEWIECRDKGQSFRAFPVGEIHPPRKKRRKK